MPMVPSQRDQAETPEVSGEAVPTQEPPEEVEPWRDPALADQYDPSSGGRAYVQLSKEATEKIMEMHRGRRAPPCYILISMEGDLRKQGPYATKAWREAVRIAALEWLVIYNARSKRCSRPVWKVSFEHRTTRNMCFESVRCVPDPVTYDRLWPRVRARIFDVER